MSASWKDLRRHPLSAEYRDIVGPPWMRFCRKLKRHGILGGRKIVLHEGMVLDGWQLQRACIETNTEPEYEPLAEGVEPREYVEAVNDERRHETAEEQAERVEARRKRVAEARQEGKSTRKIAEEENVSQTTVVDDIQKSTEQGCSVDSPDGKVNSKDGRKRPAKKPLPRCNRCIRMWPDSDKSRNGCVACYEARKEAKKPKDEPDEPFVQETNEKPPEPIMDDNGTVVPDALLPVFRMVKHFNDFERALNKASKLAKEIENVAPLKAKKPLTGKKHYGEMFGPIKQARWRVKAMRPATVCPCGEGCDECGGTFYLTEEQVDAIEKAKGIPA